MSGIVAVIPARGGSKRLHRKNIYPVWEFPMIFWSIDACKKSRYIDSVYVSSEDNEILKIAESFGAKKIYRPVELSGDFVYKQEVIVHATTQIMKSKSLDIFNSILSRSESKTKISKDSPAGMMISTESLNTPFWSTKNNPALLLTV